MAIKRNWEDYEAAILLDYYLRYIDGVISRKEAIEKVSIELRNIAKYRGYEIDTIYRNVNGITFQLHSMESAFKGYTIIKPASKLFKEIVNLYNKNREEFNKLLEEARNWTMPIIDNREKYLTWLSDQVSAMQFTELIKSYEILDEFFLKTKVLKESILQVTDIKIINLVKREAEYNKIFRFRYKRQQIKISIAIQYYINYIKKLHKESDKITNKEKNINNILDYQIVQNNNDKRHEYDYQLINEKIYKTLRDSSDDNITNVINDEYMTIDFSDIEDLSYTKPVYALYFEYKIINISSWSQLYLNIFKQIYKDYESYIPINQSFNLDFGRMDLCTSENLYVMKAPKEVIKGLYLETNLSATDIARKIKALLDICSINYKNVIIKYEKKKDSNDNLALTNCLFSLSKIYNDPNGVTIDKIKALVGENISEYEIVKVLDDVNWATKLSSDRYLFGEKIELIKKGTFDIQSKEKYIQVLIERFPSGMEFDSIDFDIFRDIYKIKYNEVLDKTDNELEIELRSCGVLYNDRIFPAECIIDNATKEKLYNYIENNFSNGNKVLYYKSIYLDLQYIFINCFSLVDETMLKEYIKYTSEKNRYYFFDDFMSTEKEVIINYNKEIENYFLSAGKPLSYKEVYEGLSYISKDIIYAKIRNNNNLIANEREHYFHFDIFECSDLELKQIESMIHEEIDDNGYAIWSNIYKRIKSEMILFIENNYYLSSIGIRNSLSRFLFDKFNFDGAVISNKNEKLNMAAVFQSYARHHKIFTIDDVYNLSKELDTNIYFESLAEVSVRVSYEQFVLKKMIEFDVAAVDFAINTYISGEFIPIKEIDSFLLFPNVGYEWNQYLLESFLYSYSKEFVLLSNGRSQKSVTGAVARKGGIIKDFNDACAVSLANSMVELKKETAINYLAEIGLITRRSYRGIDSAIAKAKMIRNRKEK